MKKVRSILNSRPGTSGKWVERSPESAFSRKTEYDTVITSNWVESEPLPN